MEALHFLLLRMEQTGLTESGRRAADEINGIFLEEDRRVEQSLTPEKAAQLKLLLEKLNHSLEGAGEA